MSTIICVIVAGVLTLLIVTVGALLEKGEENTDKPEYKVSIDQMIVVINMLIMEVNLSPEEEITLNQLVELLETRKEGEYEEE